MNETSNKSNFFLWKNWFYHPGKEKIRTIKNYVVTLCWTLFFPTKIRNKILDRDPKVVAKEVKMFVAISFSLFIILITSLFFIPLAQIIPTEPLKNAAIEFLSNIILFIGIFIVGLVIWWISSKFKILNISFNNCIFLLFYFIAGPFMVIQLVFFIILKYMPSVLSQQYLYKVFLF